MTAVNTGHKGIDIRQTANRLVFRALVQDSTGAIITSGTTTLMLCELQSDGTVKTYDFNDNTFKATACTTPTVNMTHQTANNAGTNTGVWTYALTTLTGFTAGAIYFSVISNSTATPVEQVREWQFGSDQGDIVMHGNYPEVDLEEWKDSAPSALTAHSNVPSSLLEIIGTLLTEEAAGRLAAALVKLLDVATPVLTAASVNQSGDNYPLSKGLVPFTGAVVADAGNSRQYLLTNISAAYIAAVGMRKLFVMTSGTYAGQAVIVTGASAPSTIRLELAESNGLTGIPAGGDAFVLLALPLQVSDLEGLAEGADVNVANWDGGDVPGVGADGNIVLSADSIAAIWAATERTLSAFGFTVTITPPADMAKDSTVMKAASYVTPPTAAQIATQVEAQIINETDGEQVLKAITDKIASVDPNLGDLSLSAIAAAVRTNLATELARIDAAISTRLAGSVYAAPDNADIQAIKADYARRTGDYSTYAGGDTNGVTLLLARLTAVRAGYLDLLNQYLNAAITSRLAAGDYTAPPSAATVAAAVMDEAGTGHSGLIPTNLDAKVSGAGGGSEVSIDPQDVRNAMALPLSEGTTVEEGSIDSQLAGIDGRTKNLPDAPADESQVEGHVEAALEAYGAAKEASMSGDKSLTFTLTNAVTHVAQAGIVIELFAADAENRMSGQILDRQVTDATGTVVFEGLKAGKYYLNVPRQPGFFGTHFVEPLP